MGVRTAEDHPGAHTSIGYQQGFRVDRSITINAGREQVYDFWRKLENLPRPLCSMCMCVKQTDEKHSHWIVEGPAGHKVEWDAEIINEVPHELLAWRSLPGASVPNAGSVRFEHATAGRGTKVTISLQYEPLAGQVGVWVAKWFGKDPEPRSSRNLHRLKSIIEAGEVPTSSGTADRPGGYQGRAGSSERQEAGEGARCV